MIIRMQKNPSLKMDPPGQVTTPNDKRRVARQPPFRSDLAPVTTPSARLPRRARGCQGGFDLCKSRAWVLAVVKAGCLEVAAQTGEILEMGGWGALKSDDCASVW